MPANNDNKKVPRAIASLKLPDPISLDDLQVAETAALTRAKGTRAARNEKRAVLVSLLDLLRAYVQSIADATPENAPSIIESAGLAVRKTPVRAPRVFAGKAGALSGSVKLTAPIAGPRAAYMWQYSTDAGKTWIEAAPTVQAKTTVTGLPYAATVQFRYRFVVKRGASDWSAPLSVLVD